jgi:hypothetical protein
MGIIDGIPAFRNMDASEIDQGLKDLRIAIDNKTGIPH